MASWPMVYNSLPGYAGFTSFTPTIPKLYWDVYSQEERIKRICMELHKLCEYANALNININLNHDMIETLRLEFEQFKDSGFFDYYAEQIENWINANMPDIIGKYVRMVFFGLTLDGHFVAYIPEGTGWDDIIFDTGAVYGSEEYGRLILLMDVDNASDVLPDYEHDHTELGILQHLMENLENRVKHNEETLYNPLEETEVTYG